MVEISNDEITKDEEKYIGRKIPYYIFCILPMVLAFGLMFISVIQEFTESAGHEAAAPQFSSVGVTHISIDQAYTFLFIDIGDGGLLTKDSCGPPCFWHITPGITTWSGASKILEDMGIEKQCEFIKGDHIRCLAFTVFFSKKDDIVSEIDLNIREGKREMKEVIDAFGPPDRVFTMLGELPDAKEFLDLWLFYDDISTEIKLETQDYKWGNGTYHVSEDSIVDSIRYFNEEGYTNDELYQHASQWQGYGEYLGEPYPYP